MAVYKGGVHLRVYLFVHFGEHLVALVRVVFTLRIKIYLYRRGSHLHALSERDFISFLFAHTLLRSRRHERWILLSRRLVGVEEVGKPCTR